MNALFDSAIFWVGLIVFGALALFIVNYLMGRVSRSCCDEQNAYPHRIANQLPRELHTADRDEVLELKDETELQAK